MRRAVHTTIRRKGVPEAKHRVQGSNKEEMLLKEDVPKVAGKAKINPAKVRRKEILAVRNPRPEEKLLQEKVTLNLASTT